MFEQHYELMCKDSPNSGRIALVPWDIETFGFGVADYEVDDPNADPHNFSWFREHLEVWAKAHEVELVGTTVPASDISKLYFFQSLGFRYIDTTLMLRYEDVQSATYPVAKVMITEAEHSELEPVIQICGEAFQSGRYHADERVPRHLANKRYQEWASRTFAAENPQILLVAKIKGQVCAFSIVQIDGEQGRLCLNAVAPEWQGKQIGLGLIASTMRYFQDRSVDSVLSKISSTNVPAMNLHALLGARFYSPRILLHWHAPWAAHLEKVTEKE